MTGTMNAQIAGAKSRGRINFFVVVPGGLQLQILLHPTILQIKIVKWLLDFEKFVNCKLYILWWNIICSFVFM